MRAPSRENSRANSSPRPRDPPVIRTSLPRKSIFRMARSFLFNSQVATAAPAKKIRCRLFMTIYMFDARLEPGFAGLVHWLPHAQGNSNQPGAGVYVHFFAGRSVRRHPGVPGD